MSYVTTPEEQRRRMRTTNRKYWSEEELKARAEGRLYHRPRRTSR